MEPAFFGALLGELQAAASGNDADKAAATAQRFPRMPLQPSQIVYNVAIGTCVRAEKLELATELLNALIGKGGGQPNLLTYNLLVFGAARQGDWQQAQAFFDEALQAKVRPDESTYHGLIMAYGKGKQAKMVGEVLSQVSAVQSTFFDQSINQSINQSISQVDQSINQSVSQVDQSMFVHANIYTHCNQPVNQSPAYTRTYSLVTTHSTPHTTHRWSSGCRRRTPRRWRRSPAAGPGRRR